VCVAGGRRVCVAGGRPCVAHALLAVVLQCGLHFLHFYLLCWYKSTCVTGTKVPVLLAQKVPALLQGSRARLFQGVLNVGMRVHVVAANI
jgi:hypothetical protein